MKKSLSITALATFLIVLSLLFGFCSVDRGQFFWRSVRTVVRTVCQVDKEEQYREQQVAVSLIWF